jgi:DNA-binding LacI/PurR family transcriptional regulator
MWRRWPGCLSLPYPEPSRRARAWRRYARKVEKAAKKLGYRPNVLARSLITRQSRIVAVVMAYLDNQFYPTS